MINGTDKRLYQVRITAMVMADNEEEAETAAFDEMDRYNVTANVIIADSTPLDWHDAIPFGADDERTVGELLYEMYGIIQDR